MKGLSIAKQRDQNFGKKIHAFLTISESLGKNDLIQLLKWSGKL